VSASCSTFTQPGCASVPVSYTCLVEGFAWEGGTVVFCLLRHYIILHVKLEEDFSHSQKEKRRMPIVLSRYFLPSGCCVLVSTLCLSVQLF